MTSRVELPNKLAGETKPVTFDFSDVLASGETISTQVVAATVYSGTDAAPSSLISGSATASGAVVTQKVTAGTLGVIYELLCTITTSLSNTFQKVGLLGVIPREP